MKLKAYHVYFLIILFGVGIGSIYDNITVRGLTVMNDPYFGIGYALGVTTFYGGILLIFYYIMVYYYRKKQVKKSYI